MQKLFTGPRAPTAEVVDRAFLRAAGKTALLGQQRMRVRLSGRVLNRRSGKLLATALGVVEAKRTGALITFSAGGGPSRVRYARIHEYGGIIYPVRRGVLTFKTSRGWVSAKRVRIPRRPFVRPSRDDAAKAFGPLVLREISGTLGAP